MATKLAELKATVERQAQQATAMREQIESVQVTERSASGAVEVVVDHGGRLTDLVLSDRSKRMDPTALAAEVMRCVRAASARLPGRLAETLQGETPVDQRIAQAVTDHYARMFGPPEPDARQQQPPRPPRPTTDDEGGDFAVLRKATD
jgi:DNA-binding protein YbaB